VRVLLVTEQFRSSRSGVGTYARGLAQGLADAGHEVGLTVCREEAPDTADFPVFPLDTPPGNLTALNARRRGRALRRALRPRVGDWDLVHFLDARWAAPLGRDLSTFRAVGTVNDTYAIDWLSFGRLRRRYADRTTRSLHYAWLRRREAVAYGRLSRVLANSEHVANAIRTAYGSRPDRVEVVRYGLAPRADRVEAAPLAGEPSVLFVGTNFTRKGLTELLEAVAIARRTAPKIHLHVAGGDARIERFHDLARRLSIENAVTLLGLQSPDRILAMMAGTDVFAMPSHVEAWGLVYLEAMRCGVPVIATARGGLAEVFVDGRDVFLAPPGDVEALVAILTRLAAEPETRRTIGEAGSVTAARFTVPVMVRETVAAYERTLAS